MFQNTRWRNVCFTWNNPPDPSEYDLLSDAKGWKHLQYLIFQYEVGASGTRHYQGYFELSQAVRLTALKKLMPKAKFIKAAGTGAQNKVYCTKEEGRLAGPWEVRRPLPKPSYINLW